MSAVAPNDLMERVLSAGKTWEEVADIVPKKLAPMLSLDPDFCAELVRGMAHKDLRLQYRSQAHVFKWLDSGDLTLREAQSLVNQLSKISVDEMTRAFECSTRSNEESSENAVIEPLPSSTANDDQSLRIEWERLGRESLAQGKVAAVVLAGGQGTRLGFDGPKGLFDIGLPSRKTLFQLFCERLKAVGGEDALLMVMTSPLNSLAIKEGFARNDYFGLRNVEFFQQSAIPAFTPEGKFHMVSKNELALSPNGNGGVYKALAASGLLDSDNRRFEYLHVFSVDNALCLPCDPVFVGYCISQKALVGSKVVWKASPGEKVGIMARRNGKAGVVEYSELPKDLAEKRTEDGKLVFGAGNICNHLMHVDFVRAAAECGPDVLPYHVARKKIDALSVSDDSCGDAKGKVDAVKLEAFIFDAFALTSKQAIFDVKREDDFAPVKNANGSDSPATARQAILQQGARLLRNAGAEVLGDQGVELSPSLALSRDNLEKRSRGQSVDATKEPPYLDC